MSLLTQLARAPLSAKFGLLIIVLYVLVALFAPVLAPYGETQVVGDGFAPWSGQFLLGTDNLGRDMFSRLVYGARNTLGIAFLTTVLAFLLGGLSGLIAAIKGGWVDQGLSRVVDILMAIPQLIFALLILSVVGTNATSLVLVIALLDSTRVFRLSRAVAMTVVVGRALVAGHPRSAAQRGRAVDCRIRPALLLRVFVYQRAVVPWPGHSTAHRRLGQHGPRQCGADYLRRHQPVAAGAGSGVDHRQREFCRRLDAA